MNGPNPDPNDNKVVTFKGSSSPTDLGLALFGTIIKMWLGWLAFVLLLGGAGLYVLLHFLLKLW